MTREQPFKRSMRGSPAGAVKPHWGRGILPLLLGILCANGFAAVAEQTNNVPVLDYQAFKIINERNIFNSRRYGRSSSSRRESRSTTRVESFALTGTMSYEKGPFAFFEGTRSDYQKVAKPADTIAGYTVTEITPAYVRLHSGTNEVQLRVGMQLRREDEGEWHVTERVEAPEPVPERPVVSSAPSSNAAPAIAAAAPNTNEQPPIIIIDGESVPLGEGPPPGLGEPVPNAPASASPAAPGSPDEVLRRLMERRRQEENP